MPVIAMFHASHCSAEDVAQRLAHKLDLPLVGPEIVEDAARTSGITVKKLQRVMTGHPSFFNNLTHEREKGLIYLRAAVGRQLGTDNLVIIGPTAHLIPREIAHVMKVCVVADREHRVAHASRQGLSAKDAEKEIARSDQDLANWTHFLFRRGPYDPTLHDLKIPMHTSSVDEVVELIQQNSLKEALRPTRQSLQKALDFQLATRTNVALVEEGHHFCDVIASHGSVTVIINHNVLRLEPLERELKEIAARVEGVSEVSARVGPGFNRPDILREMDGLAQPTPRYLLVDDEEEYVLTLSERLGMRDFESDVVYNGEEALSYIEHNKPAVVVLDLRMPGMGGIETLRRIKVAHPEVEVIILTGHGSEKDEQLAMELGAFAYLQKPVDIDLLARTMARAEDRGKSGADDVD